MPSRPSHLPHNVERTALQKMSATHGLLAAQLHPAGDADYRRNGRKGLDREANRCRRRREVSHHAGG